MPCRLQIPCRTRGQSRRTCGPCRPRRCRQEVAHETQRRRSALICKLQVAWPSCEVTAAAEKEMDGSGTYELYRRQGSIASCRSGEGIAAGAPPLFPAASKW